MPALRERAHLLSQEQRESMVERLLRGEHAWTIAEDMGVDRTLPSLRAYTWGFINNRAVYIRPKDITSEGRKWLAART